MSDPTHSLTFWGGVVALATAVGGFLLWVLRLVNKPIDLKLDFIKEKVHEAAEGLEKHEERLDKIEKHQQMHHMTLTTHIKDEGRQLEEAVEKISVANAKRDEDLIRRIKESITQ